MKIATLAGAALAVALSVGDPSLAQQGLPLTRIAVGSCAYQERPWWEARVTLSVRGQNGEPVRRHTVAIEELRAGAKQQP